MRMCGCVSMCMGACVCVRVRACVCVCVCPCCQPPHGGTGNAPQTCEPTKGLPMHTLHAAREGPSCRDSSGSRYHS